MSFNIFCLPGGDRGVRYMFVNKCAGIVAILRTYNNNRGIEKAVSRALSQVSHVIVVVNAQDLQTRGNVRRWLARLVQLNPGCISIFEMEWGYSWSAALNLGLGHVDHLNNESRQLGKEPFNFVMPVSVEARWTAEDLEAMVAAMSHDPSLGIVGTSFMGRLDGNRVELGRTYSHFPRNTLALLRWEAIREIGWFSPVCDGLGGMEDVQWLVRLEASGKWTWKLLDLKVELLVGVNHNQAEKEEREMRAIHQVLEYQRTVVRLLKGIYRRLGLVD